MFKFLGQAVGLSGCSSMYFDVPLDGEQLSIPVESCICRHKLMVWVFILWAICLIVMG